MSEMNSIYIPWKGWRIVRQLGRGSFGTVYEIHRDQYGVVEKAAMKVIPVPHDEASLDDLYTSGYDDVGVQTWCQSRQREILSEYALMRKLKGAYNIVECEDIEVVPRTDGPGSYIFIRMELLTPLKKYLRTTALSQDEIIRLGMEMCRALSACEDNNVVHRDVKPDNIFVSDYGVFKLGDFGIARLLEHTTKATMAGAIQFMAPEILRGEEYDKYVDIYSLGLVMYWLLNRGRMPFLPLGTVLTADQSAEAQRRRLSGERLPAPADASEELAEIVLKACAFNKKDRYASAKEMLHDLELLKHGVTQPIHEKRKEPEPVRYSAKNAQMPDNDDMTVGLFPGVNAVNNAAIRKQNMPTVYCESDEETVSEPEAVVLSVDQQQQNTPVLTNINKAKKRRLLQKIETWTGKPCRIWEKAFLAVITLFALYIAARNIYYGWNIGLAVVKVIIPVVLAIIGIYGKRIPYYSTAFILIGCGTPALYGSSVLFGFPPLLYVEDMPFSSLPFLGMMNLISLLPWLICGFIGLKWRRENEKKYPSRRSYGDFHDDRHVFLNMTMILLETDPVCLSILSILRLYDIYVLSLGMIAGFIGAYLILRKKVASRVDKMTVIVLECISGICIGFGSIGISMGILWGYYNPFRVLSGCILAIAFAWIASVWYDDRHKKTEFPNLKHF